MNHPLLHDIIEQKRPEIEAWFAQKRAEIPLPIYGSVDIRDADWKVAVVDANHFPAGFNNVNEDEKNDLARLLSEHIRRQNPDCQWVHLYPESHSRNQAYVENVKAIQELVISAGYKCTVGSPELSDFDDLHGLSGPLVLNKTESIDDVLLVDGKQPDLILLNNDLSGGILPGISEMNVTPDPAMGWHLRRKSEHFEALEYYTNQMASLLDIDPWHLMADWFVSEDKCLDEDSCRIRLASEIDAFIGKIQSKYETLGINRKPVVFLKNDRGTYGLGILVLSEGKELLNLSNRKMKKLMYSKSGSKVENFLIQEGVPTAMRFNDHTVEPVVYLVDGQAASWFYRMNKKKSDQDNLNSPSSVFANRTEVDEILTARARNWHELVAELSMLAMGRELQIRSQQPRDGGVLS